MEQITAFIMSLVAMLPKPAQWILSIILPAILTAAFVEKLLKKILSGFVAWMKKKLGLEWSLWPAFSAIAAILLGFLQNWAGITITPGDIGLILAQGVVVGGLVAPKLRDFSSGKALYSKKEIVALCSSGTTKRNHHKVV